MNRKQLLLLVGILIVVGGIGRYTWLSKQKPYQTSRRGIGEKLVPDFPLNDIARVDIIQSTQQLTLAKSGDLWAVQERAGYPADFSKLSELLRKIWDMKVAKPVTVPESRLPALELVAPDKGPSTRIDFKDSQGKSLNSLLLGAKHTKESDGSSPFGGAGSWPDGRYVMVGNDPKSIALVSDPLTSAEPRPADWMSKDFFKVEKLKSISITTTNETNNWKIQRETESGSWTLANLKPGESLDSSKVSSANYLLSSPNFNDIAVNPDAAELGLDQPRTATLTTFDDFTYTIKLGKNLPEDNYPLHVSVSAQLPDTRTPGENEKAEDKEKLDKEFKEKIDKLKEKVAKESKFSNWTYKISKWSVDFLLKDRKDLLTEKKEEEKKAESPPATPSPAVAKEVKKPQLPPGTTRPAVTSPPLSIIPPGAPIPPATKPEQQKPAQPPPADAKPAETKPAATNAPAPPPNQPQPPQPQIEQPKSGGTPPAEQPKTPTDNQPPPAEKKEPPPSSN
jgi:hypothetical protein